MELIELYSLFGSHTVLCVSLVKDMGIGVQEGFRVKLLKGTVCRVSTAL